MWTPHPGPLPQGERGIEALWRRSNLVSPDYYPPITTVGGRCRNRHRGQAFPDSPLSFPESPLSFLHPPLSFPQVFSGNPEFMI